MNDEQHEQPPASEHAAEDGVETRDLGDRRRPRRAFGHKASRTCSDRLGLARSKSVSTFGSCETFPGKSLESAPQSFVRQRVDQRRGRQAGEGLMPEPDGQPESEGRRIAERPGRRQAKSVSRQNEQVAQEESTEQLHRTRLGRVGAEQDQRPDDQPVFPARAQPGPAAGVCDWSKASTSSQRQVTAVPDRMQRRSRARLP